MRYTMQWSLVLGLAICCCLVYVSQASAESTTLVDGGTGDMTVNYMFPSQTTTNLQCANQDTCPTGNSPPDITTVTVTWHYVDGVGNVLDSIALTSQTGFLSNFDSLFINSNYTGNNLENWNYYVLNDSSLPFSNTLVNGGTLPSTGDGLYRVASNFDPNTGYTTANSGRTGHANGINGSYLTPLLSQPTNLATLSDDTLTYNFDSLTTLIILGDNFAIGWTPYCANDVVLVVGSTGNAAVPEPASMVLFGMGLASLAAWRTHRAKK